MTTAIPAHITADAGTILATALPVASLWKGRTSGQVVGALVVRVIRRWSAR